MAQNFEQWVREYRPGTEMDHGYGFTRLRNKPASPAPAYLRQLEALRPALAGRAASRRHAVGTALEESKITDLPRNPDVHATAFSAALPDAGQGEQRLDSFDQRRELLGPSRRGAAAWAPIHPQVCATASAKRTTTKICSWPARPRFRTRVVPTGPDLRSDDAALGGTHRRPFPECVAGSRNQTAKPKNSPRSRGGQGGSAEKTEFTGPRGYPAAEAPRKRTKSKPESAEKAEGAEKATPEICLVALLGPPPLGVDCPHDDLAFLHVRGGCRIGPFGACKGGPHEGPLHGPVRVRRLRDPNMVDPSAASLEHSCRIVQLRSALETD